MRIRCGVCHPILYWLILALGMPGGIRAQTAPLSLAEAERLAVGRDAGSRELEHEQT